MKLIPLARWTVGLGLTGLLAATGWLVLHPGPPAGSTPAPGDADPSQRADRAQARETGSGNAQRTTSVAEARDGQPPPTGPNIVTRVEQTPLWRLPAAQREEYLDELRDLARAGWAEAALVLAPEFVDCLERPPMPAAQVEAYYHPDTGTYWNLGTTEPSPTAEEIQTRQAYLAQRQAESRQERLRCERVGATDPDVLMTGLEQMLQQQPEGFFAAVINDRVLPDDETWIVRNAERIAEFNRGFLAALRARVEQGDRDLLAIAWRAFRHDRFLPQPDAWSTLIYGLAARKLGPNLQRFAPTRQDLDQVAVTAGLDPDQQAAARDRAEQLWQRCCALSTPD